MNRIRIRNEASGGPEAAAVGWGTVIEIDGAEVKGVRSIVVSPITVDDVLAVTVDVLASDLDVDIPALVNLRQIHLQECPTCLTTWDREPRSLTRWFSLHQWIRVLDSTHLQSPGRHREKALGERRASLEIRIPVMLADWSARVRSWFTHEVAA